MLLTRDVQNRDAERLRGNCLKDFNLKELDLQKILFRSLDRLFPDDELVVLMQSRRRREEPDLLDVDKNGNLFIFEQKAWESN